MSYYHNYGSRPNYVPPRDNITYWKQSGSLTWDPVAQVIHVNGTTLGPFASATGLPDYFPTGLFLIGASPVNVDQGAMSYYSANNGNATAAADILPSNAAPQRHHLRDGGFKRANASVATSNSNTERPHKFF